MFTREDAVLELKEYYDLHSVTVTDLTFLYSVMEPDGIIVYYFQVYSGNGYECRAVYRDNDGVNVVKW